VEDKRESRWVLAAVSGLLGISLALIALSTQTIRAAASDDIAPEEYDVYNAVMSDVQLGKDAHVLIYNDTLNFQCGGDSGNPILLNGCSGMTMPPDTPDEVGEHLRGEWPRLSGATWNEFEKRNAKSAKLRDVFLTPWAHKLSGSDVPEDNSKEWESPDGGFYFSRVGFNPPKTEAVVFVFFASYVNGVSSTGNYFMLRADEPKKWKLSGRFQYFESGGQAN
jgi:hypothetical protein